MGFLRAVWRVLGQIDDWMGRLKVVALFLAAGLVVIAVFGVLRVGLIVLALVFAGLGIGLWRAGSQQHRGIRLTAEGTVYKPEPGGERPSGVEIKYPSGRQDAIARPPTVEVGPATVPPRGAQGTAPNREAESDARSDEPAEKVQSRQQPSPYITEYEMVGKTLKMAIINMRLVTAGAKIRCQVTDPQGITTFAEYAPSAVSAYVEPDPDPDVRVEYPAQFLGGLPLVDGVYTVRWELRLMVTITPAQLLREDAIRIREGRLALE